MVPFISIFFMVNKLLILCRGTWQWFYSSSLMCLLFRGNRCSSIKADWQSRVSPVSSEGKQNPRMYCALRQQRLKKQGCLSASWKHPITWSMPEYHLIHIQWGLFPRQWWQRQKTVWALNVSCNVNSNGTNQIVKANHSLHGGFATPPSIIGRKSRLRCI